MVYYVEVAGSLILSVTDVRDLGSRRELFVDDWLIHRLESLELRLHYPIQREVALTFDRPWEGPGSYDPVITKEGDRYRLWYRGWPKGATWSNASTCYAESAESADGITWERPNLGLFEIDGSRENNVVIQGTSGVAVCVFRDQNPAAAETYKAIGKHTGRYQARQQGIPTENRDGIRGLVSADGIHWSHLDRDPIIPPPPGDRWPFYDTHNVAFWDPNHGHYVAYLRGFIPPGLRAIRRATSPDFREWTYPELIDMGDAPVEQLYKNAATLYFRAPHLYLMFPKRFMEERKAILEHADTGVSDAVFMTSRDGIHWNRRFKEAFIRPGVDAENWTDRNMYVGVGVVPTGPKEISLYHVEHYDHPTCRLRRVTLRTDGFASVHANYGGGELVTRPLVFSGDTLEINYATSAAGSVQVEIQDAEGRPFPGYQLSRSAPIYGDAIDHRVTWPGGVGNFLQLRGSDVGPLASQPVRLRFILKDADLYSFCFTSAEPAG